MDEFDLIEWIVEEERETELDEGGRLEKSKRQTTYTLLLPTRKSQNVRGYLT